MATQKVEGWSNAATWDVSLALFNDPQLIRLVLEQDSRAPSAQVLRSTLSAAPAIRRMYTPARLAEVDWDEISEEFCHKLGEGTYDGLLAVDVAILQALRTAHVDGNALILAKQLDRGLYEKVDKILRRIGGKWDRKARAHVFPFDPANHVAHILETGNLGYSVDANPYDFFPTPDALAHELVRRYCMDHGPSPKVLEPSVGAGAFLRALLEHVPYARICAYEIDRERAQGSAVRFPGVDIRHRDFLDATPTPEFDLVVMNPPFANGVYAKHIAHALQFVKPGGRLVAIASAGLRFRRGTNDEGLRAMIAGDSQYGSGIIDDLPPDTFRQAGTSVNTVTVCLTRSDVPFSGFEATRKERPTHLLDRDPLAEPRRARVR
jgi:hypothetical protein